MDQTTNASRLRYLDADDVDNSTVDFDDLDVYGNDGDKLGDLDGFLVEHGAGTVRYLVVDSGGWFTSRRFLIPAEHVTIDRDARAMRVNASRSSLRAHPEFDEDRFGRFSDDEYHAYQRRLGATWPTAAGVAGAGAGNTMYRQPDWWSSGAYRAERLRPIESRSFTSRVGGPAAGTAAAISSRGDRDRPDHLTGAPTGDPDLHRHHETREVVTAHDRDDSRRSHDDRHDAGQRDGDDVSPHFGGRAQPGDILGIETGGETTNIGDTAEDENKRRRDAERERTTRGK
jgi:hypothetical protein